ncbi:Atu4866 domain-containing protein [Lentzea sp. JNUCC 0626]|uniref:Atu4866 domain-containing protein n=1 Tax=Lentzea sp. JNUCC 0626 TaxID=3367513 RepID=UPI003749E628
MTTLSLTARSCLVLFLAAVNACAASGRDDDRPQSSSESQSHPYIGMWVTAENHIRQELLPNGRYDEARGERQSAYTGSYRISGNRIFYVDDTGFSADGEFDGDVLSHGGYLFYREGSEAHSQAEEGNR